MQYTGSLCRISCATPVLGSLGGALGVGAASVFAGHVSLLTQRYLDTLNALGGIRRDGNLWTGVKELWVGVKPEDLVVDVVIGMSLFKVVLSRYFKFHEPMAAISILILIRQVCILDKT